nr:hypothetical protein [uncultured bacterium]
MDFLKLSVVLVGVIVFALACGQPAANTGANNAASKPANSANSSTSASTPQAEKSPVKDDVAMAAELYTTHCMTCHKDSGKGGKVTVDGKNLDVEDLTTDKKKARSDDKLAEDISEGAVDDGMPAFKDKLKPAEIALVVKHVRTLQAK